jgi:acylphosphatase
MIKHFNINVFGRVQGVFFRASAQAQAEELGISGFVRNEEDGSVYIEAEAEEEKLKPFIEWCHRGPSRAEVKQCIINEGQVRNYRDFRILR